MEEDSETRSSLLWQIGRILEECKELGTLPKYLILENVPDIVGVKNKKAFQKWTLKLEKLGYNNYGEILNAKDYGIPQSRRRYFLVSILKGDHGEEYNFKFPKPIESKLRLKDFLEKDVDETYYLSDSMIEYVKSRFPTGSNKITTGINIKNKEIDDLAGTITTANGRRPSDTYIIDDLHRYNKETGTIEKITKQKFFMDKNLEEIAVPENTEKGYSVAKDGDGIYIKRTWQKRGVVQKEMIPTLKTNSEDIGVVVKQEPILVGGIGEKKSNGGSQYYQQDRIYDSEGIAMWLPASLPSGSYMYLVDDESKKEVPLYRNTKQLRETIENNEFTIGEAKSLDLYNRTAKAEELQTFSGMHNSERIFDGLRIRRLTPKECFRLMGVRDSDFEKVKANQSDSSLYHLAGDSIVTTCLKGIYENLFLKGDNNL